MKFLALAVLLFVSQAQASFLDDAYNQTVIPTFNTLVDKIKEIAQTVIDKIHEAILNGVQLIGGSNTKRDLETQRGVCVSGFGVQVCVGKRDLSSLSDAIQMLKDKLADKGTAIKDKILQLLNKLKELQQNIVNGNVFGKPIGQTVQELENAVTDTTRKTRGLLDDLINSAISALPIKDIISQVGNQLLQGLLGNLTSGLGKRGLSDFFTAIGDFFKPHVDNAISAVTGIGNTIQQHATNLWNTLTGHVQALGDKLSVHVQNVVDHGTQIHGHVTTALDALKETITDIVSQTISNISPSVDAIGGSISDGTQAVIDHIISGSTGTDAAAGSQ